MCRPQVVKLLDHKSIAYKFHHLDGVTHTKMGPDLAQGSAPCLSLCIIFSIAPKPRVERYTEVVSNGLTQAAAAGVGGRQPLLNHESRDRGSGDIASTSPPPLFMTFPMTSPFRLP